MSISKHRKTVTPKTKSWKVSLDCKGVPVFPKTSLLDFLLIDLVNYNLGCAKTLDLSKGIMHIRYRHYYNGKTKIVASVLESFSKLAFKSTYVITYVDANNKIISIVRNSSLEQSIVFLERSHALENGSVHDYRERLFTICF